MFEGVFEYVCAFNSFFTNFLHDFRTFQCFSKGYRIVGSIEIKESLELLACSLNALGLDPERKVKINLSFYFHLCGASTGMKTLKIFINPFAAPRRCVKIKISVEF